MRPVSAYVILLRGVNVGGKGKVPMSALRESLEKVGFEDVVTYIQSGNVVLRSPSAGKPATLASRIENLLSTELGVPAKVLIRTPKELVAIDAANPFGREDRSKLHVVFLSEAPKVAAAAELDPNRSPGDEFVVRGSEVYLRLANGAGRTKLTLDYLERGLGVAATQRNWNTLLKLIELSR